MACLWDFEPFVWIWGGFTIFFIGPADSPAQCPARVCVITPPSEAQDCRYSVVVKFRPSDALLNPQPGGDQGTLLRITWYRAIYGNVCYLSFFCVVFVLFFVRKNFPPWRGCRRRLLPFRVFVVSSSNFPQSQWSAGDFRRDLSLGLAPLSPFTSMRVCFAIVPSL